MNVVKISLLSLFIILIWGCDDQDKVNQIMEIDAEFYESAFSVYPQLNDTINVAESMSGTATNSLNRIVIHNPYKNKASLSLKGAMHNHTENSAHIDGYKSGTPKWTAEKFRDEGGFDFYTITDHNYVTPDPQVDGIVWMGAAVEDTKLDNDGQHLVIYNLPDGYEFRDINSDINTLVAHYHSLGALVSYAHPDWPRQFQQQEKIEAIKRIDFVEVFNCQDGSIRAYNTLLKKGPVGAFGTDDFHYNPSAYSENKYFDKSYIIVHAKAKAREEIWDAILQGAFYASTGARMDITSLRNIVTVRTQKPSTIEFLAVNTKKAADNITLKQETDTYESDYTIDGKNTIIWIKVSNDDGQAISQAIRVKHL